MRNRWTPLACILLTFAFFVYSRTRPVGIFTPRFGQALHEKLNCPTENDSINIPEQNTKCDVCLLIRIGDNGCQPPSEKNLPFTVLHKLFEAVGKLTRPAKIGHNAICVGVDYSSVVCRMVRDSLGSNANCWNTRKMQHLNMSLQVNCNDMVVGKTNRYLNQQTSIAGRQSFISQRLHFVDLDAEDPKAQPPTLTAIRPTIVTGFSGNHLSSGLLFLRSVGKAAADARKQTTKFSVSVVVWTMENFTEKDAQDLQCVVMELNLKWLVQTDVREFDFSAYPAWMRINQTLGYFGGTGEYAWKAIMIHIILVERGFVLWQDAGCRYKTTKSLTETLRYVSRNGFASRRSAGFISDWTFPAQLQYLRASNIDLSQPNCDGSSVGFTLNRYKELARPWYECSLTRQCIAPDGSDRSNHRQDQAALTVIAALSKNKCEGIHRDVRRQMDNSVETLIGVESTLCYTDPRQKGNLHDIR